MAKMTWEGRLEAKKVTIVSSVIFLLALALVGWQRPDVAAVRFLGDYPRNREPGWSEEAQGLANDNDAWYIAQKDRLWRIPVERDLNAGVSPQTPGVRTAVIPQVLRHQGYNHFGDPDCFEGKLFVPLEGSEPCKIAVFRAQDLSFLSAADLTALVEGEPENKTTLLGAL